MSEKKKWLAVIIKAEVYPITVEASTAKEAEELAVAMYDAGDDVESADTYFYVEDVLEEN